MIANISARERIALGAAGALILITVLWLGVLEPYRDNQERLETRIKSRSQQLAEMKELSRQYALVQKKLSEVERGLARSGGTSLFSHLESIIGRIGIRDKLSSLRPQKNLSQGQYLEESAELKLEKIYLDELILLLHDMETGQLYLHVKNLRIKPRFEDADLLDASLQISTYRRES